MRTGWTYSSYLFAFAAHSLVAVCAHADVIDLTNGEYSTSQKTLARSTSVIDFGTEAANRMTSGVMDLDRPAPKEASVSGAKLPAGLLKVKVPQEIERLIQLTGLKYIEDPRITAGGLSKPEWLKFFRANIAVESGFDAEALSPVGALGLGQLMPETAAMLGVDPHDPEQNLDGSARYLLAQLGAFGSSELALAAYNAGPEAVAKYHGIPPYEETQGHVQKVMALFHLLNKKEPTT